MNAPSEIKKGTRQNMFFCEDHIDLEVTDIGTDYKAAVKHLLYHCMEIKVHPKQIRSNSAQTMATCKPLHFPK